MNVVLGPCPCSTCGRIVVWDGWEWKNANGRNAPFRHICHELGVEDSSTWGYTSEVGVSDQPNRLSTATAYLLLTPGGGRRTASRE